MFDADHAAHQTGGQMMAIANDAGPKLVGGELFEKIVFMARQKRVGAVTQMGAEAGSGGNGSADNLG